MAETIDFIASSFFLLPDIRYIRYIRYIRPCESVAELPSSFFLLPSSFCYTKSLARHAKSRSFGDCKSSHQTPRI